MNNATNWNNGVEVTYDNNVVTEVKIWNDNANDYIISKSINNGDTINESDYKVAPINWYIPTNINKINNMFYNCAVFTRYGRKDITYSLNGHQILINLGKSLVTSLVCMICLEVV